jgi:leucyl-tRNA synthetase
MIDYSNIEKKWQDAWDKEKAFEVEPNDKESRLITAAFPYVNMPLHIGHLRTYATTDTYARYLRMRGFNVLFPMGFHASGIPILSIAKRIAKSDPELIEELKIFNIPDEDIKKMSDPLFIAEYFTNEMTESMKAAGFSIDWRRKFISIDPLFSKFVEWQFSKLKEKGYLEKGVHPVGWCTNDMSAIGQHDTLHDTHPEIEELTGIKFKDKDSEIFFVCTTYRPETIYGVTNLFVNKNSGYSIVEIKGEKFYVSKAAAASLSNQFELKILGEVTADALLKKNAINPETGESVPVFPGFFVKEGFGTGIVMSVPAHAPFDYVALEKLKSEGYNIPPESYKKVIAIPDKNKDGQSEGVDIPALAHLESIMGDSRSDYKLIEEATKKLYREEAHHGIMSIGKYEGKPESEARELIKKDMISSGTAISIYVIGNAEPVICRCGTEIIVKKVDQWFINYGNKAWKDDVRSFMSDMKVYPPQLKGAFNAASEWIGLRATERSQGLGTKFPYEPSHIIESLSDSTIYPVFYTIFPILKSDTIKSEQLKPEFFDFVVLNKGDVESISAETGIDVSTIKRCQESVNYWYVNTSRHSAPDLIYNHYMMYIYNHIAILPKKMWPKQVVVNGMVTYEGEKMSKSLGNVIPLLQGIKKYGADSVRFIELASADIGTDTNFTEEGIKSIEAKNNALYELVSSLDQYEAGSLSHIDYWLYSKLNSKIKKATESMDRLSFREAYTEIYYNSITEIKQYLDKGGKNQIVLKEFLDKLALMLQPIMPHIAEELWHVLGNNTFASKEKWPEADMQMINQEAEKIEEIIDSTEQDIKNAISLTSKTAKSETKKPKSINIIIAADWKAKAYDELASTKKISDVIDKVKGVDKATLSEFLSRFSKRLNSLEKENPVSSSQLKEGFEEAKEYLGSKFGAEIAIELEEESKSQRAKRALPTKPSIDVIW